MSLGQSLKEARAAMDFTQEDIAKKLYVTRQTVSRWEQNKTLPNIFVLQELSSLYGLSIDELISETKKSVQKKEEEIAMKKFNWFALAGVLLFNLLLFSVVALTIILLVFSLWLVTGTFILSPMILLGANIIGVQSFSLFQSFISILLCLAGLVLYPLTKKTTRTLVDSFTKYVKYNKKMVYSEES
ncbi:helix-turn-helix domain-containing protein [Carnobacterium sp.]|uniref:helix-turn-helix domain-containing protein n=1 Tax=Carnobacterium sp. TaxID=48221 RepID=UPI00388E193F